MSRQFEEGSGIWWGTDKDGKPQVRGANMGRPSSRLAPAGRCRLFKVRLHGDYDDGGAYWGGSNSVYCLRELLFGGEVREWFRNARTREEAEAKLREDYPDLKLAVSTARRRG